MAGFFGGFGVGAPFEGGGGFFQGAPPRFDHQYQVYPVVFAGKDELEKGNKIILPPSALDHLARLNISYPMLFDVQNPNQARKTNCGVQEFVAEEGMCYLPFWMMNNLLLKEGDLIRVQNTSLPKGTYVKLQPLTEEFTNIHNPRAVLENTLRNFATLTVGDCIVINYNSQKFEIDIVECKPSRAISIVEADVNVDFAPPKNMKEPEPAMPSAVNWNPQQDAEEEENEPPPEPSSPKLFAGAGKRIDGKPIKACSPKLAPSTAPVVDEFARMPWKKKIPLGVKYTTNPFGYGEGHMTGKKSSQIDYSKLIKGEEGLFGGNGKSLE